MPRLVNSEKMVFYLLAGKPFGISKSKYNNLALDHSIGYSVHFDRRIILILQNLVF